MRDFNLVKAELISHLKFSTQADDGTIYWYEGTIPLLCEMLGRAYQVKTKDGTRYMTAEELERIKDGN